MQEWEPIGVRHIPEAFDEYDTYAAKAYVMLMDERASAEDMARYLISIESEYMGLGMTVVRRACCRRVSESLVALRPQFEA